MTMEVATIERAVTHKPTLPGFESLTYCIDLDVDTHSPEQRTELDFAYEAFLERLAAAGIGFAGTLRLAEHHLPANAQRTG